MLNAQQMRTRLPPDVAEATPTTCNNHVSACIFFGMSCFLQADIAARAKELKELQASTKEAMLKTQQLHETDQAMIKDLQKELNTIKLGRGDLEQQMKAFLVANTRQVGLAGLLALDGCYVKVEPALPVLTGVGAHCRQCAALTHVRLWMWLGACTAFLVESMPGHLQTSIHTCYVLLLLLLPTRITTVLLLYQFMHAYILLYALLLTFEACYYFCSQGRALTEIRRL